MTSQTPGAPRPLTALVTGFEPFAGASSNPSWEAVRLLPDHLPGLPPVPAARVDLVTHLLPVTFAGAARQVRQLLARYRPDVVVHVGLNERAPALMLETRAVNEQTARIPDNAGDQPAARPVVAGGPQVLDATWAAPVLAGRLQAAGVPSALSDDAGRYVCNSTLYTALDVLAPGAGRPAGFLHVPGPDVVPTAQVTGALTLLVGEMAGQVARARSRADGSGEPGQDRLRAALDLARSLGAGSRRPLRVGVTGGIGSGKSTFARLLGQRGARVVDADALARELVRPGEPALADIARAFGQEVLAPDGQLDRAALAAAVFSPQAPPGARERLDAIMLPRIALEAARRMDAGTDTGRDAGMDTGTDTGRHAGASASVNVYDVPLLVEGGMADLLDVVVVVQAPEAVRLARLEQRGLGRQEARDRMSHQASDAQRREVADVVVPNGGDVAALEAGADRLWQALTAPALSCRHG